MFWFNNTDPLEGSMERFVGDEVISAGIPDVDEDNEDEDCLVENALRCITDRDKKVHNTYNEFDGDLDDLIHKADANIVYYDEDEDDDNTASIGEDNTTQNRTPFSVPRPVAAEMLSLVQDKESGEETQASQELTEMFELWGRRVAEGRRPDNILSDMNNTHNTRSYQKVTQMANKNWGKGLYQVEHEKRGAILDEMHGVKSRAIPETPQLIESSLNELEEQLNTLISSTISSRNNSTTTMKTEKLLASHIHAVSTLKSNYVTSKEFRIRFLRHEFFNVEKATTRYLRNLNFIFDLFGDISLLRPLYLTDLSTHEWKYLKKGCEQLLTSRDKLGRRIYVHLDVLNIDKSFSFRERLRCQVYWRYSVLGEDETAQINGAVNISMMYKKKPVDTTDGSSPTTTEQIPFQFVEDESSNDNNKAAHHSGRQEQEQSQTSPSFRQETEWIKEITAASPMRYIALHWCMPDEKIYHFFKAVFLSMQPQEMNACTRVHAGSQLECNYSLCPFGIPIEDIPATSTGNIKNTSLIKLINARTSIDDYRKKRAQCLNVHYVSKEMEEHLPPEKVSLLNTLNIPITCPGTDCPEASCFIFGDKSRGKHAANVVFRDYLKIKLQQHEQVNDQSGPLCSGKKELDRAFLDDIIDEVSSGSSHSSTTNTTNARMVTRFSSFSSNLKFTKLNKKCGWFEYLDPSNDRIELRKLISQLMRDERKRSLKKAFKSSSSSSQSVLPVRVRSGRVPPTTKRGSNNNNNNNSSSSMLITNASNMGLDAKRFKRNNTCVCSDGSNDSNENGNGCFGCFCDGTGKTQCM